MGRWNTSHATGVQQDKRRSFLRCVWPRESWAGLFCSLEGVWGVKTHVVHGGTPTTMPSRTAFQNPEIPCALGVASTYGHAIFNVWLVFIFLNWEIPTYSCADIYAHCKSKIHTFYKSSLKDFFSNIDTFKYCAGSLPEGVLMFLRGQYNYSLLSINCVFKMPSQKIFIFILKNFIPKLIITIWY